MISVVVLNWNGKQHLEQCLSSLLSQSYRNFEIILVDNGSTDGSVELVDRLFPDVRVLPLQDNLGFCGGNNAGIRAARGDLIALLNNDTEADHKWLETLSDSAQRRPDASFFASKMLCYHQRNLIDDAGDEFHTAGFASRRGWLDEDGARYSEECEVFGACAGAAMYRRAMLDDVGLLDEHFFANGEDVDLSFRARLRGYRCLFVPDAIVYHKGGQSIGKTNKWFYWIRRNQLWVMMKNMPWQLVIKHLPKIIVYNALSLVYHSTHGRGRLICRAYFDAFSSLPRIMSQRKDIQAKRRVSVWDIEAVLTKGGLMHRMSHPVTEQEAFNESYSAR